MRRVLDIERTSGVAVPEDAPEVSDRALLERFDLVYAAVCTSQHELLTYVAATDTARFHERDGYPDHASWLAGRFGISHWAAHRWIHAAHALERLPLVSDALSNGRLSLDKVLDLTRFAVPETEKKLISWARRVSPAAVRRRAELESRQDLEDAQAAEEDRALRWWSFDEGRRWGLSGEFPAATGAAIAKAITRVADRLPSMPYDEDRLFETDPDDTFETRCADALSLLASGGISDDSDADRATVVVHTQLGKDTGGEIEDGPILHPETVRRISCDSRLEFVLHDVKGEALGIGHTSRNIPRWLMRQLRYRDGGCTFPGCGRRVYLQGHHIWHWEDGGPTDLCNLVLVCGFHHKLLHEFGWKVWLHGSESHWYRPSGRRFDPGPDPPVHDPQPQQALVSF